MIKFLDFIINLEWLYKFLVFYFGNTFLGSIIDFFMNNFGEGGNLDLTPVVVGGILIIIGEKTEEKGVKGILALVTPFACLIFSFILKIFLNVWSIISDSIFFFSPDVSKFFDKTIIIALGIGMVYACIKYAKDFLWEGLKVLFQYLIMAFFFVIIGSILLDIFYLLIIPFYTGSQADSVAAVHFNTQQENVLFMIIISCIETIRIFFFHPYE